MKRLLLALAILFVPASAWATCGAIPLTIKDASSNTQNISSATAADGNCKTYIDADTSSQIHTDLTAADPCLNATAYNTNSYSTGQTNPVNCDLHGNRYVNLSQVGGNALLTGAGAVGSGAPRVTVGQDTTTIAGSNPGRTYNTIAASQTTQALTGGSGGATGDYLSHCTVIPTSTSPGVVTIIDNSTTVYAFPGGASSLSNLVPFTIPVGAYSVSGAWKITTGASLSVVCVGKFT